MDVTLYTSLDGYVTFRTVGDTEPVLRVTCPEGQLGETCGKAVVTDVGNALSIATVANATVKHLQERGCVKHNHLAKPVSGADLDTALAYTSQEDMEAAVAAAFAAQSVTIIDGRAFYTGRYE